MAINGLNGGYSAVSILSYSTPSSGIDFVSVFGGAGQAAAASPGSMQGALEQAEKNEAKELAQVAKDPIVQRDIDRYTKVVKSAKSVEDVLDDPIARKVLMKAAGLGAYVDQVALAKKAMMSNPNDPNSLANKLSGVNGAWLQFAKTYDLANTGLDRLSPQNEGFTGNWTLDIKREGEPLEVKLQIRKAADGKLQAVVNGVPIPASVTGDTIAMTIFWEDEAKGIHTSHLTGKVGRDGTLSGPQSDDGRPSTNDWQAEPYYAGAIKEVTDNYMAETRLDRLDQQTPGLGTAILFMKSASQLDTTLKILGQPLGREVVTTALGLPKQLALQSIEAQTKAIEQRIDASKLKDESYARKMAVRYLVMLNGGVSGITA